MKRWPALLVAAAVVAFAPSGLAADAQKLLVEGDRAMAAGKFPEACAKYNEAQDAQPMPETLIKIASCLEKQGRTGAALQMLREAEQTAHDKGKAEVEREARTRTAALEPSLARLVIVTAEKTPGMVIRRDGFVMDEATLSAPVPVDPGPHTIEASAPEHETWSTSLQLGPGESTVVRIPTLFAIETERKRTQDLGRVQRTVGVVVGVAGLASAAFGTFFGLRASSKWHDAQDNHCVGTRCDAEGGSLASDAHGAATLSTVTFVTAGVLLAAGAVIYFVAPKAPPRSTGIALVRF